MASHWPAIFGGYLAIFLWLYIPNIKRSTMGCLLLALFFPVTIPGFLIVVGVEHYFLREHRLRRKLLSSGRLMSRGVVPVSGTIILDSSAFNHCRYRIWWTPDNVLKLSPVPPQSATENTSYDTSDYVWPPFDRWIWENYLETEGGQAKLIFSRLKHLRTEDIQKRFPACVTVTTFSGGRSIDEMNKKIDALEKPNVLEPSGD